MSKKSKRRRHPAPLQATKPIIHPNLATQALIHANQLMKQGDFQGVIHVCERLFAVVPPRTPHAAETLALMGLAHGMLNHFSEGYAAFNKAVAIDPQNPELWYNHSIACSFTERTGQALRSAERAVQLLGPQHGEFNQKMVQELATCRQAAQKSLRARGKDYTLDQLIDEEEHFQLGLTLIEAEKWPEAERAFRHITESSHALAANWVNLGVCLTMQKRYNEAEAAFKRALELDPGAKMTIDNLAALPKLKPTNHPENTGIYYSSEEPPFQQIITLYHPNPGGPPRSHTTIEKAGATTSIFATQPQKPGATPAAPSKPVEPGKVPAASASAPKKKKARIGKQPPRYRFFLNPYEDVRFTNCPKCRYKTRLRKFPLFIHIEPDQPLLLNKSVRFCPNCELLILHQDELEEQLAYFFSNYRSELMGHNYLVLGTVDRPDWQRGKESPVPMRESLEYLHDFKQVLHFEPAGGWVREDK